MPIDLKDIGDIRGFIKSQIAELKGLSTSLYGDDFLLTWDKSDDDIKATLIVADLLHAFRLENRSTRLFDSGLAISYFRDFSTRTRYSFDSAANLLGLEIMPIDESKIQVAHGETVRETAAMLCFLTDAVGIRDDLFLRHSHGFITEFASALKQAVDERTLDSKPMVVNLQSDVDHPTQSMSDLNHLKHYYGGLDKLAGKKIALTWAYSPSYGKPLSVAQGVIGLMTRFGMDVVLAHPPGYELMEDVLGVASKNAKASGGSFEVVNSMEAAFEGADVVYPKSWAPMTILEERSALVEKGVTDPAVHKALEQRCLAMNAEYTNWECTDELMAKTKDGAGLYMHCLPADITGVSCKAGEVTESVFSRYRVETYFEAKWKPYIIAAMLFLGLTPNAPSKLKKLWKLNSPRLG